MTTLTKDAVALFLSTVAEDGDFDTTDETACKAAIRQITGAKKVSAALLAEFVGYAEAVLEQDEPVSRSIVKKSYKLAYKPLKNTCGDEFARLMEQAVKVPVEEGSKHLVVDVERLVKLAKVNKVWRPEYSNLNVGQQRMNIGNRLRAMAKRDEAIVWAI